MKKSRKERRSADRKTRKDVRDRIKLSSLEAGGSEAFPLTVESASLIETRVKATPCVACGGSVRVDEHAAVAGEHGPLRIVVVRCPTCGAFRRMYFRIVGAFAN